MRAWTTALALAALTGCVGAYGDSGIIDSGPLGCCNYTCDDGETEGSFVSSSEGECEDAARTSCSSAGSEVDAVDFLEGQECAR